MSCNDFVPTSVPGSHENTLALKPKHVTGVFKAVGAVSTESTADECGISPWNQDGPLREALPEIARNMHSIIKSVPLYGCYVHRCTIGRPRHGGSMLYNMEGPKAVPLPTTYHNYYTELWSAIALPTFYLIMVHSKLKARWAGGSTLLFLLQLVEQSCLFFLLLPLLTMVPTNCGPMTIVIHWTLMDLIKVSAGDCR